MFLFIFSIALVIASIFFIKKRRFIAFFFPMMLFLPDYYGFEISPALPLLTVKRILYIVLYIYIFLVYRKKKTTATKKISITPPIILVMLYFVLRISSNIYYIFVYRQAAKTILLIIFELLLLFVALSVASLSGEQYFSIVKAVIFASAIMYVLGIAESFTGYRIVDSLYTVNRFMINDHYIRAGLLRATVSLALPNYYGNFCVLTLPLIMYLYENTKSRLYLVFGFLNALACIHSGARSSFVFMIAIVGVASLLHIHDKKRILKYIKHTVFIALSLITFILVLSLASNKYRYYYTSSGKSVLNMFGFEFDLDKGAPEGSDGFGSNEKAIMSRTAQFSGIAYVAGINPIFGLGSGAQIRGDIQYFWNGYWKTFRTYDVGYVEVFAEEGAIGWIACIMLFSSLFIILVPQVKENESKLPSYLLLSIIAYFMCMLSSANMWQFLFFYIILIFFSSEKNVAHQSAR